ncbi:hypothetical protein K490DRAFT_59685 [Saccharata proteae CBS 121410]|uniref:Uncharacterized protein n=1 Tax=Saccharata proteae CBS 121410 TaxID=1314787 RepID=A0A9P4HRH2_9PEZI|nr:hypothetical protein K490DRAFT_59685 [Saccharata proteae CBS 121410]
MATLRRLADVSDDPALDDYLRGRKISPDFLKEIDGFRRTYPEIILYDPGFAHIMNRAAPLDAYKHFVSGFHRPARYLPDILPQGDLSFHPGFTPARVADASDEELDEFLTTNGYDRDILNMIDDEVASLVRKVQKGHLIHLKDRKLLQYALWGNPVDAYKQYEFHHQLRRLRHHYVPDHTVLEAIPKGNDASATIRLLELLNVEIKAGSNNRH